MTTTEISALVRRVVTRYSTNRRPRDVQRAIVAALRHAEDACIYWDVQATVAKRGVWEVIIQLNPRSSFPEQVAIECYPTMLDPDRPHAVGFDSPIPASAVAAQMVVERCPPADVVAPNAPTDVLPESCNGACGKCPRCLRYKGTL